LKTFRLPRTQLFNRVYGLLTVIAYAGRRAYPSEKQPQWLCRCRCGKYTVVTTSNLKYGKAQGCGCTRHLARIRHGYCRASGPSPEYNSWSGMKHHMGPKPDPSYSLDRKDNNGDYEPDNCHWASRAEQAQNTRQNRNLTLGAETLPLTVWARRLGIERSSLRERLAKGMSVAEALTCPARRSA